MKNLILILMTLVLPVVATTSAFASRVHMGNNYNFNQRYVIADSDCVTEYMTKLDEKTSVARQCYLSQPLVKSSKAQTYPNLRGNPRLVDYWLGSYSKDVVVTTTTLRELVDNCASNPHIFSSRKIIDRDVTTRVFELDNLNLHDDIIEDIMTLGMLPAEAARALDDARLACLEP